MKVFLRYALPTLLALTVFGCTNEAPNSGSTTVNQSVPSASPSPSATQEVVHSPLTLPILDALLTNDAFNSALKSKLQLTAEQIDSLKRVSSSEVARLRQSNAEDLNSDPADARSRASDQIAAVIGPEKTNQLSSLVADAWANGGTEVETGKKAELQMSLKPNAVPTDTRIVVNIPAFRMDLFKNGELVKSYKIGIGYPEFPLPQGLRKAQTIIFNPTWTPPDSPWVASMKNVAAGEKIEAGSKDNPLGPIKIPIGMPSLIHGGKSPAKLGQFASHGCVGLTNAQVKDFAKQLAQATETQLSEKMVATYLQDRTKTSVVKLKQTVPVELRYETIVIEDGRLHIYKDVYDQNTNTEENLRLVLEANGSRLEDLSDDEKTQVMVALNSMSAHPKKMAAPSPQANSNADKEQAKGDKTKKTTDKKVKSQKEIVIEVATLAGKGYPVPVNLDNGTGKPASTVAAKTTP